MGTSRQTQSAINQIAQKCEYWEKDQNVYEGSEKEVEILTKNLLDILGISQENIKAPYQCGANKKVDFAAKFESSIQDSTFAKPDLIIECKAPSISFTDETKKYADTVSQLQGYLRGIKCKSVSYGIIFNGLNVQLFRKHGMLSYPISPILSVNQKNISQTIKYLQQNIQTNNNQRGTIITVWNNKGGVGKTTIAQSLAILLNEKIAYGNKEKNRVLLVDYDHNQGDLTANCKMDPSEGETKRLLDADYLNKLTTEDINNSLHSFTNIPVKGRKPRFPFEIKVLRADQELSRSSTEYIKDFAADDRFALRQLCLRMAKNFDYIIIDAPPNYEQSIFSKEAVSAADCILPVALYQNDNSIRNYARAAIDHIQSTQKIRKDGGPYSLGIWFNRWRSTWIATVTRNSVKNQIDAASNTKNQIELKRIFYKNKGRELRKIIETADIARSIMDTKGLPGVVRFIRARSAFDFLLNEFSD